MTQNPPHGARRPRRRPVLHYLEMVVAMCVGMAVLGPARKALGLAVAFHDRPGVSFMLMASDMAAGMAVWMRLRGHGWPVTLQMCAVMYLPLLLVPLVRIDAISTMAFMVSAHVLMLVAMAWVLWRHHGPASPGGAWPW